MKVEIWSDVVCPWCYIGKRRFETALSRFDHRDEVEVVWKAFELDPSAPVRRDVPDVERLAQKYGMSITQAQAAQDRVVQVAADEDLDFDFSISKSGNTFDAHRVIHHAFDVGGPVLQDAVKERFMAAYFCEGAAIGERDTIVRLAAEAGLDADAVRELLDSDDLADEVRHDEREASTIGVRGVPFFVFDRAYAVAGAQDPDVLLEVLETAWTDAHPLAVVSVGDGQGAADACTDDTCIV